MTASTSPFAPLAAVKFDAPAEEHKKNYMRTTLDSLDALQALLGLNDRQIGDHIGYSASAAPEWRERGDMPVAASMACQLLLERHAANSSAETIVVVRIPADKKGVILPLFDSMGVSYSQV